MRTLTISILVVAAAFVCCFAQSEEREERTDIAALQEQRIKLLEQRIAVIEEYVGMGLTDRSYVIQAQIDLINARLEYAPTKTERRALLTELLGKCDQQIRFAELAIKSPPAPPQAGSRPQTNDLDGISKLLLLKSERIRIQILRDTL